KFQDKRLLYRLTIPDSIKDDKAISEIKNQCPTDWNDYSKVELKDKAQLFFRLAQVQDRTFRFKKYRSCFVGCEIVDRMVYTGLAETRETAVQLGIELAKEMKIFVHVSGKNWFADDSSLYVFSEGVLAVIYEVQLAEKNQKATPSDKSSLVAATLLAPSQEKKLSPFERMMMLRRGKKTQTDPAFAVLASDDDDNSVLSAPEMSQAGSLDESRYSAIGLSNSFDTLGDLVAKYGWGNESVLTFKLEEDLRRQNSAHVLLGVDDEEAEDDSSAVSFPPTSTKNNAPTSPVYEDPKEEFSEEQSLISEPKMEESLEDSPRAVADYRVVAYSPANGGGQKRRSSADMKALSLDSVQTSDHLASRHIGSIFVNHSSTTEEEMTQITMDNALTASSSGDDIGRLLYAPKPEQNPEQSHQAPFRARPKSCEISPNRHNHHQQQERRPHSYSSKYSVSQHTSSSYSQVSVDSTTKHRIAEILRKELWKTRDDSTLAFFMEELCRIMAVGSSHKAYVVHCGGVMVLMRMMEEYLQNESIQFYCCSALAALAALDLDTQSAVSQMDGIPLVVRSMQSHVTSSRLQEAGRSALAAICYDSQV
ncbi:MAG: hypothetical protein SGILL_005247, partial [Bacillariaceae sp.]